MSKKTKNYNLITLLQSLSDKERKQFHLFVISPYYNLDEGVTRLFQILEKEVLSKKIFNDAVKSIVYHYMKTGEKTKVIKILEKEQYNWLRAKMSLLLELAQKFLINKALAEDSIISNQLLSKKLLEKKQFSIYERIARKQQKKIAHTQTKGITYYEHAFQVEQDRMTYFHRNGLLGKEDNFPSLHANLDMYYIINKLKLFSTMHSILNAVNKNQPYDFVAQDAITKLLELSQYTNQPIILFYKTAIQLMEKNEESTYHVLLDLLQTQQEHISKNDLIYFYHGALNFCISQIHQGKVAYYKNIFHLYKAMEEQAILMESDFVDSGKLNNVIAASCRVREFDWAIAMVHKYCPLLPKVIRESLKNLYLAGIAFHQSNYDKTIEHLNHIEPISVTTEINRRILQMKSFYEKDESYIYATERLFRSAMQFFHLNKEIATKQKKAHKNFVQIVITLYRYRFNQGKKNLTNIRVELEQMELITDKKWLLEKSVELT